MDIHDACENGNIEFLIKVLTDTTAKTKKFTVYTKDENGRTPLLIAIHAGYQE